MCTDSYVQNKRCHCHDQIRCWMLMCTSRTRHHRRWSACSSVEKQKHEEMISFVFFCPDHEAEVRTDDENKKKSLRTLTSYRHSWSTKYYHRIVSNRYSSLWHPSPSTSAVAYLRCRDYQISPNSQSTVYLERNEKEENRTHFSVFSFFSLSLSSAFCLCFVIVTMTVSWLRGEYEKYKPVRKLFSRICHTKVKPLRMLAGV